MQTTHTIETPVGKNVVVLKDWITGAERETINSPIYKAVGARPMMQGGKADVSFEQFSVEDAVVQSEHKEIEVFVVSVDGKTDDILKTVLGMHEDDTAAVKEAIKATSKKKE